MNARPASNIEIINRGLVKRSSPIPADLIATSSKVSPRFPKVIIDESNTASGRASGTRVALNKAISRTMSIPSIPLPTKSSIHSQKNWMINTNSVIKKVAMNGPIKERMMSISSFLITSVGLVD